MSAESWMSDLQFAPFKPLLLNNPRGVARVDDRRAISGISHVLMSGGRWVDAPAVYGPKKTLYNLWVRWAKAGVFRRALKSWRRPAVFLRS